MMTALPLLEYAESVRALARSRCRNWCRLGLLVLSTLSLLFAPGPVGIVSAQRTQDCQGTPVHQCYLDNIKASVKLQTGIDDPIIAERTVQVELPAGGTLLHFSLPFRCDGVEIKSDSSIWIVNPGAKAVMVHFLPRSVENQIPIHEH